MIAAYNRPETLQDLIDDLAKQDLDVAAKAALEVVVVDDGSTPPLAVDVPADLRCAILRQANAGPGAARDLGIRAASGEVMVIVDDDMTVPADFIGAHLRAHEAGATVVLGLIREPEGSGRRPLFDRFHHHSLDRFVAAHRDGHATVHGGRMCTGNASFRRDAYMDVGGFDTSMRRCEDRDLGLRMEVRGERFVFEEEAWSSHRSDHADVQTWFRRSAEWGAADVTISAKLPDLPHASPWAFFADLPRLVHPMAIASAALPMAGRFTARGFYAIARLVDRTGKDRLTMMAVTMSYAMSYYAGVGTALKSRRSVWDSYRAWKHRTRMPLA